MGNTTSSKKIKYEYVTYKNINAEVSMRIKFKGTCIGKIPKKIEFLKALKFLTNEQNRFKGENYLNLILRKYSKKYVTPFGSIHFNSI